MIGHDHKFMQEKPPLSSILRNDIHQKLSHPIGLRKRTTSGCRRSHEKRTGRFEQLGAFSPGLKPGLCTIKRSRGFENPLPRTEVRGWHGLARIGMYWRGLACIGTDWNVLARVGMYWRGLACTGTDCHGSSGKWLQMMLTNVETPRPDRTYFQREINFPFRAVGETALDEL
jgi:hypothetical protein